MTGYPEPKPAVGVAITILRDALDSSIKVGASFPPRVWPRLYVHVTRAGGGQHLIVTDTARLLIECWADSPAAAETLTSQCRAALRNAHGRSFDIGNQKAFIRGFDNEEGPVELNSPNVPDKQRWQFQGDLHVSTN